MKHAGICQTFYARKCNLPFSKCIFLQIRLRYFEKKQVSHGPLLGEKPSTLVEDFSMLAASANAYNEIKDILEFILCTIDGKYHSQYNLCKKNGDKYLYLSPHIFMII
jgi:hypothetical protein